MADISQIKLPSGDTFDIIDEKSGYIKTSIYHGTSASAAADTIKVVTCEDFTSSDLKAGAAILVTFSTTNSAAVASLALNVNGTGVKNVKYINNGTLGNLSSAGYLKANTTYLFIYDGTYWVVYFNYNTTYSSMSEAEARAGTATTARTVTAARLKDTIDYTLENKTDYSIPVSRAGEIVIGETAIGTDSTNFPTSKAVVDYVDERVVQEMDAIDVGVTGIKANGTSLSVVDGVVNIPAIGPNQSVGLITENILDEIYNNIPTSTSQLDNDSGFITSETDPTVPAWAKASTKPTYTANEVGALPSDTVITDEKLKVNLISGSTVGYLIVGGGSTAKTQYYTNNISVSGYNPACLELGGTQSQGKLFFHNRSTYGVFVQNGTLTSTRTIVLPDADGTFALTSDIPTIPTNISSFTNDSGYLTASDIASVMTYKGTKANYAALPSTGNTTGDVWHLTDTGAEWAWDGSTWQELGTAIDLSSYATKATTLAGYGITDAKIQNGTITLGGNTITPLTSYTETDPIFGASAAAGITSTDISNWNAKVSDTGKWNDVSLNKTPVSETGKEKVYVPLVTSTSSTTAYLMEATFANGTKAGSLARYNANSYLISTTPSANDNSTKVATTAYVDGAVGGITVPTKTSDLTNDSGFITSYTDEKVKSEIVTDSSLYIVGTTSSSTATGTLGKHNSFRAFMSGNTNTDGVTRLYLGNSTAAGTAGAKLGAIQIFSNSAYYVELKAGQNTRPGMTANRTVRLPDADGTIALTSDIPQVYSSNNTGGYLTMATLPIYNGTVV